MIGYKQYAQICQFIGRMRGAKEGHHCLIAQIGCHVKDADTCIAYEDDLLIIVCDTKSLAFVCWRKENHNPVLSADEEGVLIRAHGEVKYLHEQLLCVAEDILSEISHVPVQAKFSQVSGVPACGRVLPLHGDEGPVASGG